MPNTPKQDLREQARRLGIRAYEAHYPCAPIQDMQLLDIVRGRGAGITPAGEANSGHLIQEWIEGWKAADTMAKAAHRRAG
jgi:hypothetical protein